MLLLLRRTVLFLLCAAAAVGAAIAYQRAYDAEKLATYIDRKQKAIQEVDEPSAEMDAQYANLILAKSLSPAGRTMAVSPTGAKDIERSVLHEEQDLADRLDRLAAG